MLPVSDISSILHGWSTVGVTVENGCHCGPQWVLQWGLLSLWSTVGVTVGIPDPGPIPRVPSTGRPYPVPHYPGHPTTPPHVRLHAHCPAARATVAMTSSPGFFWIQSVTHNSRTVVPYTRKSGPIPVKVVPLRNSHY